MAKTKEIEAMSGLSVEVKTRKGYTRWVKAEYREVRTIEDGDDLKKERKKLWQTVCNEVDAQIEKAIEAVI